MSDRNLRIKLLFDAMDRVTKPLRDIAGGSSRTADKLKAMRDRLREVDRAQADIAGFREAKAGAKALEERLQSAQARATQLGRAMTATQQPTKKMAAEFARAKREAAGLEAEHSQEIQKLQQLRDRLAAAGVATGRLAAHERELRREASRTNAELAEQARRLERAQERAGRFAAGRDAFGRVQGNASGLAAGGAAAIGTGVAIGTPIVGAVGQAMAYESVMTDIAQKANLARRESANMGIGLLAAAKAANQLPESLQQGVDVLSGFGLDPRQAVAMMTPIGRAATAYKAEIADLSAAAFAGNDNLKVPIAQTERMIDVMAQAGKSGAFEIRDMAQHFPSLTAASQALGQKGVPAVADLAAALQITRKGAGDSSTAANNLLNLLNKINTEDTIKNFKEFGIDLPKAMKAAAAAGKSPIEAIAELAQKATKGDLSKLSFLFGDAQVQAALRPLIQNVAEYKRIRAEALSAKGVVDKDFADRLNDGAEQARKFKISATVLGLSVARLLLPAVNELMTKGAALANRLSAWADRHPVLAKYIGLTVAGIAALLVVLGAGAIALAGIMAPFASLAFVARVLGTTTPGLFLKFGKALIFPLKILPRLGSVFMLFARMAWAAGALLMANPIVLAIMAIVAVLAFAGYMIWKHWATIKVAFFSSAATIGQRWAAFRVMLAAGWNAVVGVFNAAIARLAAAWAWIRSIFSGGAANAWGDIKAAFHAGIRWWVGLHVQFAQMGANLIQGLISGITGRLGQLKSTIVNAASAAATWFKQKLGIHSPSRVFMGLGGYVMAGLDRGLAGGAGAPIQRLTKLSRDMTAAIAVGTAVPAMAVTGSAGAANGVGGGRSAAATAGPLIGELHVHGTQGMDERALARFVAQEVAKAMKGQAGKGAVSFGDAPDGEFI